MKKKFILGTIISFALLGTVISAAATKTPAEIVSDLTDTPVNHVIKEKHDNKVTYAHLAKKAGKLEEFKKAHLNSRKADLQQRVENGAISQQQADNIVKQIEKNQTNCDGSGNAYHSGNGYGSGNNQGHHGNEYGYHH